MRKYKVSAIVTCIRSGVRVYAGSAANDERLAVLLGKATLLGTDPQVVYVDKGEADHIAEILGTKEKK